MRKTNEDKVNSTVADTVTEKEDEEVEGVEEVKGLEEVEEEEDDEANKTDREHRCEKEKEHKNMDGMAITKKIGTGADNVKEDEEKKEIKEQEIMSKDNCSYENDKEEKAFKKTKKNTAISTFSPAYISDPIYQWEVSSNDRIFYDKVNDFVIHQNAATKALLVTDIKKMDENYNGVYVKFDKELCEHICFNLNGSFFLYYCINPNKIEISDILSNHNIYLNVEVNKLNEYEILSVFWLKNPSSLKNKQSSGSGSGISENATPLLKDSGSSNSSIRIESSNANTSCDFVVVTNCSIEIFEITFDSLTIQPLKKHFINSQYCWYDENSSYIVLLSNKNHVLLPYLLNNGNAVKLPKIELNIPKSEKIKENDIQIVTIYNETYCIHKDHKNGRISFRCLSSTFYFDYVVDLFCNGVIDVSIVDNLLIAFNNSNEKVYVFDILHKKKEAESVIKNSLTSLNNHTVNITYITQPKNFKRQINFNHIQFHSSNVIVDNQFGNLYKICIDYDVLMLQICQYFSNLNTSVDVLLRRPNCKNRVTEMMFLSLENDIKIEDFLSIVTIINVNYRKLVEQVAKKNALHNVGGSGSSKNMSTAVSSSKITSGGTNNTSEVGTKTSRKITQLLDNLLKNIEDKTLITERDIVINVFHPYMIKRYNLKKKETLFNFSINFRQVERNMKMQKKKLEQKCKKEDEMYMLKYKIKRKQEEHSDFTFDSDTNSSDTELYGGVKEKEKSDDMRHFKKVEKKTHTEEQNVPEVETAKNVLDTNCDNEYNLDFYNYSDFQNVPLFLIYVLEYMKSLLYLNILPNRILQTFIFDLCIFFKQDNCLRQLLQFYTISDSVEITKRLFHFWKLTEHKWAFHFCLDMSLRLKEYDMIIHLFLCAKQYLKVMSFLRKYNLVDYPILVVLQAIENDFDLPDKYIVLNHVLQSLSQWIEDCQNDPIKYPMPNLQNCQKWFELVEET